jgi:hypothetical protein
MCPVERAQVSACRPNSVIGLSLWSRQVLDHHKRSDDMRLTIRFDRCDMLDMMFAGDRDAYQTR